jgi:putative transposase
VSADYRETIRRTYKYRAYPSKAQVAALETQLSFCCDLYNAVIELRREMWRTHGVSLGHLDVSRQLTDLVRSCPELLPDGISRSMLQKTLERANEAFQAFYRRVKRGQRPGYPRFKSKRRFDTLRCQYGRNRGVGLDGEHFPGRGARTAYLDWRGVGRIRLRLHRPIPEEARITEVQVKRCADGWHVCLGIEMPKPAPLQPTGRSVGVDLGITSFVALSTGEQTEGPRAQRKAERRVAALQRELARKRDRRSGRRRKAIERLAKARLTEARIRRDHQHKLARRLVRENDVIYLEDLNVKGLAESYLAKDVRDQAWSQFRGILADKAVEAGRLLVLVDPRGSSQECCDCGATVAKTLSERVHRCPCGLTLDRDVNAARVILRRGERQREALVAVEPNAPACADREIHHSLRAA